MERGGMPLHDAVGENCENGATTEYQVAGAYSVSANGCLLDNNCAFVI